MAIEEEEAAGKENDGGISTNEFDPSAQKVPHLLLLVEFCDGFSDICIFPPFHYSWVQLILPDICLMITSMLKFLSLLQLGEAYLVFHTHIQLCKRGISER